jgi:hypothetical protein
VSRLTALGGSTENTCSDPIVLGPTVKGVHFSRSGLVVSEVSAIQRSVEQQDRYLLESGPAILSAGPFVSRLWLLRYSCTYRRSRKLRAVFFGWRSQRYIHKTRAVYTWQTSPVKYIKRLLCIHSDLHRSSTKAATRSPCGAAARPNEQTLLSIERCSPDDSFGAVIHHYYCGNNRGHEAQAHRELLRRLPALLRLVIEGFEREEGDVSPGRQISGLEIILQLTMFFRRQIVAQTSGC